MLVPLSSVSLSRPTRLKFIVLFPCIARAESVIATILYCNTVYTAVDYCFAVYYYCSIYIFLEWRDIFESCLQIQACPAQENSRSHLTEKRWLGLIFRAINMRCMLSKRKIIWLFMML